MFEGRIRRDPSGKNEIVVANLSCNSSRTAGGRPEIVANVMEQDPDLCVFLAATRPIATPSTPSGGLSSACSFGDIIRDRPTICIPDDHDVGHGNVWGESGKNSTLPGSADGGYKFPVKYVNQVQRQQSWHLPDWPGSRAGESRHQRLFHADHRRRCGLRCAGGIANLRAAQRAKSRRWGRGPTTSTILNTIQKRSTCPACNCLARARKSSSRNWAEDWTNAEMKGVLSQTAFCGAVHMHGGPKNRPVGRSRLQRLAADAAKKGG